VDYIIVLARPTTVVQGSIFFLWPPLEAGGGSACTMTEACYFCARSTPRNRASITFALVAVGYDRGR
jgi:hypothetical protein